MEIRKYQGWDIFMEEDEVCSPLITKLVVSLYPASVMGRERIIRPYALPRA
jgi:hypothetical protein